MEDIYFKPEYGELYEGVEHGKSFTFKYENEYGSIHHMFIKREIKGTDWCDLTTPYGYGGPIVINYNNKARLIESFYKAFKEYCIENKIVSEFVRFHPILNNADNFGDIYDITSLQNTVGTNLRDYEDPFPHEFSKSCRKKIRNALKEGVKYKVTKSPSSISEFKKIYYSTMDRNRASDYYYFDEEYFNKCLNLFPENIVVVEAIFNNKIIAMGFYFVYKKYIHIHLSGTLDEYLYLSPAYILRYAITLWGKENGYELIHHGGGRTKDLDDTLYTFKKRFGKNTDFKFKIGKKIWNHEIYNKLCGIYSVNEDEDFFPAYRKKGNEIQKNSSKSIALQKL